MTSSRLPAPTSGSDYENCPAGNHPAVCVRVIDLGTQETKFGPKHQIMITWEICKSVGAMEDGRPYTINSYRYNWNMDEKSNLRRDLTSWRGKPFVESDFGDDGFDIANLLGVPCMLNVQHTEKNDKTYANVVGIARIPKGLEEPVPANPLVFVWLDRELFNVSAYESLSDYLKTLIGQSPEYSALVAHPPTDAEGPQDAGGDEVPF